MPHSAGELRPFRPEVQAFIDSVGPVPFDWRQPVPVTMVGGSGLACRICIARLGLRGDDHRRLLTAGQFVHHLATHLLAP